MKDEVDAQLRDQQAGSRKDRSCTDQIATLRVIVEQSVEWNSSLYINFTDFVKASTVWTGEHYGNFFDTTEFLRRLPTLCRTHTTDYSAKWCMEDS